MCLYPKLIKNPKYRVNKKNRGEVPQPTDQRVLYVPVGCGLCFECMRQKSTMWKTRLIEEIKNNPEGYFITLTFSNEWYTELAKEIKAEGYALDNEIATLATRRFLERWRKEHGKSVKHWLITELGHNGTENVHMHGIIWTDKNKIEKLPQIWKYGFVWKGYDKNGKKENYITERTATYITKYMTKTDPMHKYYKAKVLCSKGIGKIPETSELYKRNKYNEEKTRTTVRTSSGHVVNMPIYWRNKIYDEKEREQLWMYMLDKNERFVGGEKVKADNEEGYNGLVEYYRKLNKEMGYGSPDNYDAMEYEHERRKLLQMQRMEKRLKQRED